MANVFVGCYARRLLEKYRKQHVYLFYVGDTFSIFDSINDATEFQTELNSLHPSLLFTMEVKNDCNLSFLGISC